ncbi:hypothetical protein [Commensalibacter oyaizuii]|uniref:Nitrite/Sulfite reductase ferredoxin-like domain-containing protein n=1 Tax=Commensalibacter oyaizuii TaxID=3043873 RepID=A0ABT6Q359_9PROT|nr:hypothetical protein [Commensalibacter sp. TBRC 16381]MDI2090929.1 hypothetical protein [Commensalibacter sp. TBRC 16381]
MNNIRRGWCPSLYRPMETGDGFLCRIKPFFSSITSDQAFFIAQIAKDYGNGYMNISQKANLQLRGFSPKDISHLIPSIVEHHLASPDLKTEEKRNFLISPFTDLDPLCHPETKNLAVTLQDLILQNCQLHPLSGKFSFLVDGQGQFSLDQHYSDINIRAHHHKWCIQLGRYPSVIACDVQTAPYIALEILQFCINNNIKRLIDPKNAQLFLDQTSYPTFTYTPKIMTTPPVGDIKDIGIHVGIPFGLLTATQLQHLGVIAQQFGNATLQLTPWHSIILPNCSTRNLSSLTDFIITPEDPRLNVILCPGKPFCIQGQQPTLKDITRLLPHLSSYTAPIHLSGCAKGCASPQSNPITLCATSTGYNLIFDGKATEKTSYQDLNLTEIISLLKTHSSSTL